MTSNHDQDPPDLPGYRFVSHAASGGNAEVYRYKEEMPERDVAVKVLNHAGLTEAARAQFIAEANAMAVLAGHPNIVQVLAAAVTPDGRPYLVMPYYSRPNLYVRARREHFPVAEALRAGIQIGGAVEASHRRGIMHRDIKPQNILTGQWGEPALTDFGIATRKGAGGPDAMSVPWSPPEVLDATSPGNERSDVYSLAATLWHVLTGRSPFELPGGDNAAPALMARIRADPPPATGRGDVPESLERLLRQAMAKNPAARPQTALDFVRMLQAVEGELRLPPTQAVIPDDIPGAPAWPSPAEEDSTIVRPARVVSPEPGPAFPAFSFSPPERALVTPQPSEPATRIRPQTVASAVPAVALGAGEREPDQPRSRRAVGIAAGGVVVAAAIGGAVVFSLHGAPEASLGPAAATSPASAGSAQDALGPGAAAPGMPAVTVARASAGELRFRWSYANHVPGDVFRWRRVSGGTGPAAGTATTPSLLIAAPSGRSVCVTVQVVRADGSEASEVSAPACAP